MLLFYRIWHHKNNIVLGKGDSKVSVSVAFLENYLVSLNPGAANEISPSAKGKSPCTSEIPQASFGDNLVCEKKYPWLPPPPGWIKLNVDASYDHIKRQAGTGFVARNHQGDVVFLGWSCDSFCGSAEEAECLAALSGIRKGHLSSLGPIVLESDCLYVVQALTDSDLNRSRNRYIIEKTKRILSLFQQFQVSKCHRRANGVAHELRQFGRKEFYSGFLSKGVPACASAALKHDCKHDPLS
jgi:ribonuclease HI